MIEQKFAGAHQAPEQIFQRGSLVVGAYRRQDRGQLVAFRRARITRKTTQVDFVDNRLIGSAGLPQLIQHFDAALGRTELVIDRIPVGDVEYLDHGGYRRPFTLTHNIP